MNKGIHSRGYLPHWDFAQSTQALTFRLADAVPQKLIRHWKRELISIGDDALREVELRRQIESYADAGHGSSVLRRVDCAEVLQNQLIAGHPVAYRLIDWCIMPNHVHVLCRLQDDASLGKVIRSWKGASAVTINRLLNRSGPLWLADYFDRYIRDLDHLHECIGYIHLNPVKAKLCAAAEDWPFSSVGTGWDPGPYRETDA